MVSLLSGEHYLFGADPRERCRATQPTSMSLRTPKPERQTHLLRDYIPSRCFQGVFMDSHGAARFSRTRMYQHVRTYCCLLLRQLTRRRDQQLSAVLRTYKNMHVLLYSCTATNCSICKVSPTTAVCRKYMLLLLLLCCYELLDGKYCCWFIASVCSFP